MEIEDFRAPFHECLAELLDGLAFRLAHAVESLSEGPFGFAVAFGSVETSHGFFDLPKL